MNNSQLFLVVLCAFSLSACLKATGPAQDPFDLENEEPKLSLGGIFNSDAKDNAEVKEENTEFSARLKQLESEQRTSDTGNAEAGSVQDVPVESAGVPPLPEPSVQQQQSPLTDEQLTDFESWKQARESGSEEYQQFQEFQEFKAYQEWLRLQKLQQAQ